MATNNSESTGEKIKEFFTQDPVDRDYEGRGGDSRWPKELRGNPHIEASICAAVLGDDDPYPEENNLEGVDVEAEREKYNRFAVKKV